MSTTLHYRDLTRLDLPIYTCKCGELNIHNVSDFKVLPHAKYSVLVERQCHYCDLIYTTKFRTTAGKQRPRMISWFQILFGIFLRLPGSWRERFKWKFMGLNMWLERKLPL